jgi:hypothetical protein
MVTPNATNDEPDISILSGDQTTTAILAAPDQQYIGVGSLFAQADFSSGQLEARCTGFSVKLTPTGNRLNVGKSMRATLAYEASLSAIVALSTLHANDTRTKYVPKKPGKAAEFCGVLQNEDTHTQYDVDGYVAGYSATEPLMVISFDEDNTAAPTYLIEYISHWEVTGTTVLGSVRPQPHHKVLHDKIHAVASEHYTTSSGNYQAPQAVADHISKKVTGLTFSKLLNLAEGGVEKVGQGIGIGSSLLNLGRQAGSFLGEASGFVTDAGLGAIEADLGTLALAAL